MWGVKVIIVGGWEVVKGESQRSNNGGGEVFYYNRFTPVVLGLHNFLCTKAKLKSFLPCIYPSCRFTYSVQMQWSLVVNAYPAKSLRTYIVDARWVLSL